jgi:hypothetical protein
MKCSLLSDNAETWRRTMECDSGGSRFRCRWRLRASITMVKTTDKGFMNECRQQEVDCDLRAKEATRSVLFGNNYKCCNSPDVYLFLVPAHWGRSLTLRRAQGSLLHSSFQITASSSFQFLIVLIMAFRTMTQCSVVGWYWRSGGTCCNLPYLPLPRTGLLFSCATASTSLATGLYNGDHDWNYMIQTRRCRYNVPPKLVYPPEGLHSVTTKNTTTRT